ncbi:MAG TPA: hypothetical protein VEQ60_15445 [Longimicrobium sp.]|nr:hypothetical protein [Longimicrobium sp.]
MMMRIVLAWVGMMALLACRGGTGPVSCDGDAAGPMRILFIGNSLTYSQGLPYMVRALADSLGEAPVVEEVAMPDFSLEDHWNDGRAARAIRGGCWNYVVLQQGPSSRADSRALLLDYAARFDALVRRQGGRSALYSVWPAASRRADFDRAIESYALAADAVDGLLLPAATAWLEAWEREPGLDLYQDDLHPTQTGAYLAALVITARLTGRAPAEMPAVFTVQVPGGSGTVRFDPATAATLKAAAQAALERHPEPFSGLGAGIRGGWDVSF